MHDNKRLKMSIQTNGRSTVGLRWQTMRFYNRLASNMTGLSTQIGFTLRAKNAARIMMCGAEMTGVHYLRGEAAPSRGFYHIGGAGLLYDESIIRALGETVERYAQFTAHFKFSILENTQCWGSYASLADKGEDIFDPDKFSVFSAKQYDVPGFPFAPCDHNSQMMWIKSINVATRRDHWIPSQAAIAGYSLQKEEKRHCLGVTTGGAAHITSDLAARNGLLELFQIDTAMGNWFGHGVSKRIIFDERTSAIETITNRLYADTKIEPQFYYLVNPDLPGFTIACILKNEARHFPAVAVGLGSDLCLEEAMYKALLEGAGVAQLSKIKLTDMSLDPDTTNPTDINKDAITDLDSNVAFYGLPMNGQPVLEHFDAGGCVHSSELPADGPKDPAEAIACMLKGAERAGLDLFRLDMTTSDIAVLGFHVIRIWSPDTITLCLPSAPPALHPRFDKYGGFRYHGPHPYP